MEPGCAYKYRNRKKGPLPNISQFPGTSGRKGGKRARNGVFGRTSVTESGNSLRCERESTWGLSGNRPRQIWKVPPPPQKKGELNLGVAKISGKSNLADHQIYPALKFGGFRKSPQTVRFVRESGNSLRFEGGNRPSNLSEVADAAAKGTWPGKNWNCSEFLSRAKSDGR